MHLAAGSPEFGECEDGRQAAAMYASFLPHLVLMDISMKGIDGLRITAEITAKFPEAKIYMLTQYEDSGLREAAREAGACGYLLKDDLSQVQALLEMQPDLAAPEPA